MSAIHVCMYVMYIHVRVCNGPHAELEVQHCGVQKRAPSLVMYSNACMLKGVKTIDGAFVSTSCYKPQWCLSMQ